MNWKDCSALNWSELYYGIERGQIEAFMRQRGFQDVKNQSLDDLKAIYLTGSNASRVVPTGIAIAAAVVVRS